MTTVEIRFRFATQPSETAIFALSKTREVYGIRGLSFDRNACTLCIEYDATRLNAATVCHLVRLSGFDIVEESPSTELPPAPVPAPVA